MKKIFQLLPVFILSALAASAQITINAGDIEPLGITASQTKDLTPDANIAPGGTGLQTWDFSNLKDEDENVFTFLDPANTPHASLFPAANLAAMVGDTFLYFSKTNDRLEAVGSYGTFSYSGFQITAKIEFNPGQSILRFPANLNDTYNETTRQKIQVQNFLPGAPYDSLRLVTQTQRSVVIDAFGTMTTPLGAYETLRFKETEISRDSAFASQGSIWSLLNAGGPDTIINYNWWTNENNLAFPLVQVKNDLSKDEITALWLKDFVNATHDLLPPLSISLYPNPAVRTMRLQLEEAMDGQLEIYDFNGRQVKRLTISGTSQEVDMGSCPAGSYLAVLKSAGGDLRGFRRFELIK
ncbi:MAG: T9SS type A sorting domain-containing protein [Lewinellaceae bacterium]|nr:T9SS type A sorting domain-containing protein [Saprospiraceae bacterium]MCB9341054.1 T9SS type A sorting domain-containing protein [Lewinellaceae bacterium]